MISGKLVHPIVEGGKGVSVTTGRTAGAFAAAGAVGTFSGVNADSYDENGKIIPYTYKETTRRGRHEELIELSTKGAIAQAKIAHDISGGRGRIHTNVLWEMGGCERILIGILEGAKGLIHGVTCGAGMPYKLAEIVAHHKVYAHPIVSSARAFNALWKRAYSKYPQWLGSVVYEDPWLAGGHNGLSNAEDPNKPQDPYPRVAELLVAVFTVIASIAFLRLCGFALFRLLLPLVQEDFGDILGISVMKLSDVRLERRYTVYMVFEDIQGLNDKSQVRIAGVEVGQVEKVELDELFKRADFITLHVPKNDKTANLINKDTIAKMKDGVRIINCARGGIIVEKDLKDALDSGKVAGAALDVFEVEPAKENLLFKHPKVICTPHLGASTSEAQFNVAIQVAEQMSDYLINGAVTNALNMPSISAEDAPRLKPYMRLAEKLGAFAGQITNTAIQKIEIEYQGHVAELNVKPLTSMIVAAVLKPLLENVNIVSAPQIANGVLITGLAPLRVPHADARRARRASA